jgi:DNA-binding NarL/FixJ family response regulator
VELVRELHEANPSIPVLVLTHLRGHDVHEEFLKAGAAEVLSKKHTVAEMFAAVRRLGGN